MPQPFGPRNLQGTPLPILWPYISAASHPLQQAWHSPQARGEVLPLSVGTRATCFIVCCGDTPAADAEKERLDPDSESSRAAICGRSRNLTDQPGQAGSVPLALQRRRWSSHPGMSVEVQPACRSFAELQAVEVDPVDRTSPTRSRPLGSSLCLHCSWTRADVIERCVPMVQRIRDGYANASGGGSVVTAAKSFFSWWVVKDLNLRPTD